MNEMTVKEFLAQKCLEKGDIEGYRYWANQFDEVRYKMDLDEMELQVENEKQNPKRIARREK